MSAVLGNRLAGLAYGAQLAAAAEAVKGLHCG